MHTVEGAAELHREVAGLRLMLQESERRTREALAFSLALLATHLTKSGCLQKRSLQLSLASHRGDGLCPEEVRGQVAGYVMEMMNMLEALDQATEGQACAARNAEDPEILL